MARKKNRSQAGPGSSVQPATGPGEVRVPQPGGQILEPPPGYAELLADLKARIASAQVKAALAVNRELISLYWETGKTIVARQRQEGWGKGVIEHLARDLHRAFPGMSGFSASNIWRMRAFYLAYCREVTILAQPVRELPPDQPPEAMLDIPWGHNIVLVEKIEARNERLWYAGQTIQQGWSRAVLVHQIESGLYERQGKALTNFDRTLPAPQSDLARETLKDPYNFEFLTIAEDARELELQRGLVARLRDFLLELGVGFAYVGERYPLKVADKEYFLDLLFYHLRLRCFIVIDLKVEEFEPEHAGKMNFYLSAVDDLLRHPDDKPSIGLILCKEKNRVIVEYSLRDTSKPMGVATYELRRGALPEGLRESLPSSEQIEAELKKQTSASENE